MKSSVLVGALVLCLAVMLTFSLMPRDALATTFYKYKWTYPWTFEATFNVETPEQDLKNDAVNGATKDASLEFAKVMAEKGHWYKVEDVSSVCTTSDWRSVGIGTYSANFTGSTIINFDTDISQSDYTGWGTNPDQHGVAATSTKGIYSLLSAPVHPSIIEELLIAILYGILQAVVLYPWVFAIIVLVTIITIAAWVLHSIGGVSGAIAPGLAGQLITAILAIGIIIALIPSAPAIIERLFSLGKKAGKKVMRKGRQALN